MFNLGIFTGGLPVAKADVTDLDGLDWLIAGNGLNTMLLVGLDALPPTLLIPFLEPPPDAAGRCAALVRVNEALPNGS